MEALQPTAEGQPNFGPKISYASLLQSEIPTKKLKEITQYRGKPAVLFTKDEIQHLSKPFKHSLVGKFSKGRPSMDSLRKEMLAVGFKASFSVGLLDYRHVLIKFELEEDYLRCWLKRIWSFQGFLMRTFKWTSDFRIDQESSIVPIWIRFEHLPIHLFEKYSLFSIASSIGNPLKMDASTSSLIRPSVARICVELDLTKEREQAIWIGNGETGFWQDVTYENVPDFCHECKKIGHASASCDPKGLNRATKDVMQMEKQPAAPKTDEGLEWRKKQHVSPRNEAQATMENMNIVSQQPTPPHSILPDKHAAPTSDILPALMMISSPQKQPQLQTSTPPTSDPQQSNSQQICQQQSQQQNSAQTPADIQPHSGKETPPIIHDICSLESLNICSNSKEKIPQLQASTLPTSDPQQSNSQQICQQTSAHIQPSELNLGLKNQRNIEIQSSPKSMEPPPIFEMNDLVQPLPQIDDQETQNSEATPPHSNQILELNSQMINALQPPLKNVESSPQLKLKCLPSTTIDQPEDASIGAGHVSATNEEAYVQCLPSLTKLKSHPTKASSSQIEEIQRQNWEILNDSPHHPKICMRRTRLQSRK